MITSNTKTYKIITNLLFFITAPCSNSFILDSIPKYSRITRMDAGVGGYTRSPIPPANSDYLNGLPTKTVSKPLEVYKEEEITKHEPVVDNSIIVQGGSLRTWSYRSPLVENVEVALTTEGRPLDADLELWHGPDNTPCKMRVYVENGQERPFTAVIATPRGPNTIAIRNIGQIEFPLGANVNAKDINIKEVGSTKIATTIQGGALRTYPFDPLVKSVQVHLKTDGRPLNARIELLQGPNNNKQVVELYTEDGFVRRFLCVLETPGSGNVVRVVNTAPVEFPMTASVVPNAVEAEPSPTARLGGDVVIGGDLAW